MVILASSAGLRDESGYDLNGSLEIGDQMIILSRDDSSKLEGRFKASQMHGLARRSFSYLTFSEDWLVDIFLLTLLENTWWTSNHWLKISPDNLFFRIEVKKFRTFRQQVTWLGRFNRGKPSGKWGLYYFVLVQNCQIFQNNHSDRIWEWKEGGGWLIGFPGANGRVCGENESKAVSNISLELKSHSCSCNFEILKLWC